MLSDGFSSICAKLHLAKYSGRSKDSREGTDLGCGEWRVNKFMEGAGRRMGMGIVWSVRCLWRGSLI